MLCWPTAVFSCTNGCAGRFTAGTWSADLLQLQRSWPMWKPMWLNGFVNTRVQLLHWVCAFPQLTLILLTWTIWRPPTNASKWRMGFNSAFKWLTEDESIRSIRKHTSTCATTDRHLPHDLNRHLVVSRQECWTSLSSLDSICKHCKHVLPLHQTTSVFVTAFRHERCWVWY